MVCRRQEGDRLTQGMNVTFERSGLVDVTPRSCDWHYESRDCQARNGQFLIRGHDSISDSCPRSGRVIVTHPHGLRAEMSSFPLS